MRRFAWVLLLAASGACCSTPGARAPSLGHTSAGTPLTPNATVVRVIDGDTVDVRVGSRKERVRLIGVDTPETKKPNTPVQCYGPEASAFTESMLPIGTPVYLERDAEPRDPYHRLLAYVYLADGTFVNLELAARGYARVLTIAPNTAHTDDFVKAAGRAQAAHAGLWGRCTG